MSDLHQGSVAVANVSLANGLVPSDPASPALLESRVQHWINVSRLLPGDLYEIFERSFLRGQSEEAIQHELGLTTEQYTERHRNLMRSFRQSMPGVGA